MSKLPAVKPRQVIRFLEQNGFVLDHTSGSHLVFYHPVSHHRAVVPEHNRDLPKGTLMSLSREAGFTREQMIRLPVEKIGNTQSVSLACGYRA
jgi:predicted RNA binding protein YcfA (HicA-like mRNA interferase family)